MFSTREVLSAHEAIKARRKATGQAPSGSRYGTTLRPMDRIRPKHLDAVVAIEEAALLLELSPATIRSWIHRGHLTPLASSKPRSIRLRLGDVVKTAHARRLPQRIGRPLRF